MNLYKRNKRRTNRKLIAKTDNYGAFVSTSERTQTMGENFPAGKCLGLSMQDDEQINSFVLEMDKQEAKNLLIILQDFVKD